MLKKILLASIFVITAITSVTYAEDDMQTAASKAYVDTKIETKQLKIPAANQPNVGAGETVMTYTSNGNGEIGERGLYSDISSYDANIDADKLITASALNATFTNLPTTPTTKLECANQADGCTLWTIVDQTAYRKSKNLLNPANIHQGTIVGQDGRAVLMSNRCYFDFIKVNTGDVVYISVKNNTPPVHNHLFRYSENNENSYIGSTPGQNFTFGEYSGYKFNIDFDGYIRGLFLQNAAFTPADVVDAQVVIQNNAPTSYEPYY